MKYPRKFPEVSDSSRCLVFFTDTVWIVGPLGQAKSVLLKLSKLFQTLIQVDTGVKTNLPLKHQTNIL